MQLCACAGVLLLAPDSRGATWDALPAAQGAFGPDVAFLRAALSQVLSLYRVEPDALGIEGFSDGATYALGLGTVPLQHACPQLARLFSWRCPELATRFGSCKQGPLDS